MFLALLAMASIRLSTPCENVRTEFATSLCDTKKLRRSWLLAFAKHTGRLGVCVGTTGPGANHLLNGLYDAALDGAPVVALTGLTFHDLSGIRYQQGVDTLKLMQDVAVYNEEVTGPEHAIVIGNRACRAALGDRGAAHLTVSKDVQMMKRSSDKRSMRNPGTRSSSS